jgi:hypothetical protein
MSVTKNLRCVTLKTSENLIRRRKPEFPITVVIFQIWNLYNHPKKWKTCFHKDEKRVHLQTAFILENYVGTDD